MNKLELDWYLSCLTRKAGFTKHTSFINNNLRNYYLKKYRNHGDPWIVINDFDNNLKLNVDRSSYIGSLIYWRGYHSINEIALIRKLLKPNMTFVDVGANQGEYTIFAAKRLTQGKVISFEPLSTTYKHLEKNIELNQLNNVITYKLALSDIKGNAEIYGSEDLKIHNSFNEGLPSLYKGNDRNFFLEKVQVEIFDKIWQNHNNLKLDLIKIDAEGSELPILKGAKKTIKRHKPLIILEINEETFKQAGYSKHDIVIFLDKLNYKFDLIYPKGVTQEIKYLQIPKLCNIICY